MSTIISSMVREVLLADGWHKVDEFYGTDDFRFDGTDPMVEVERCVSWNEKVGAERRVANMKGEFIHMIVPIRSILAVKSYPLKVEKKD